jgi:hypothetical protein
MSGVTPLKSKSQTDWNKCCFCRTEKKGEDLKSRPTHYSCSKDNDGYYMIATNIPLFQGINQLLIILDPIMLDEGGGIEETLRRNHLSSCFVMACRSSDVGFSFSHKNTHDLQC